MGVNHNWSIEIYELVPQENENKSVKTDMVPQLYVNEYDDGSEVQFLASLDPFRKNGATYNLNRRAICIKLTERKDGHITREWKSKSFVIDRTSSFDSMLLGITEAFEDEEEELFDALGEQDVRCVKVDSFVTVCTRPYQEGYTAVHGAALSIHVPASSFTVHRAQSPVFEKRTLSSPLRSRQRSPAPIPFKRSRSRPPPSDLRLSVPRRHHEMTKACNLAREAAAARSWGEFEHKQHIAVTIATRYVDTLRRQLDDAEEDLQRFKRLRRYNQNRYRSPSPPPPRDNLRVTFRARGRGGRNGAYRRVH